MSSPYTAGERRRHMCLYEVGSIIYTLLYACVCVYPPHADTYIILHPLHPYIQTNKHIYIYILCIF